MWLRTHLNEVDWTVPSQLMQHLLQLFIAVSLLDLVSECWHSDSLI